MCRRKDEKERTCGREVRTVLSTPQLLYVLCAWKEVCGARGGDTWLA